VDGEGFPRADIDLFRARELRKRLKEIQGDYKNVMKQIESGLLSHGTKSDNIQLKETLDEKKARLAPKPKPKYDPISKKWVVQNWDGTVAGIESGHLKSFDQIGLVQNHATTDVSKVSDVKEKPVPFAIIDEVFPESPADKAGLRVNDLIVEFGTAVYKNHQDLAAITRLVLDSSNISILVLRRKKEDINLIDTAHMYVTNPDEWHTIRLRIQPMPWDGRGRLGCHLKQL